MYYRNRNARKLERERERQSHRKKQTDRQRHTDGQTLDIKVSKPNLKSHRCKWHCSTSSPPNPNVRAQGTQNANMAAANRFSNATMASKLDLPKSDSLTILSLGEGHSKTFQGTHFKNTLHWPSQRASWVSVYPSTPLNWRPFGDVYPLTLLTRGHPLESNGVGSNPATWSQF